MVTVVRVVRVLLLFVLALMVISFAVALGTSGTGMTEKIALVGLIIGCVFLALLLTRWTDRVQERLRGHPL